MTDADPILERLQEVIALTFGVPADEVAPTTVQDDLVEWDSLGHLNLMVAVESTFDVRLDLEDMANLTSVAAIVDYLRTACPSS